MNKINSSFDNLSGLDQIANRSVYSLNKELKEERNEKEFSFIKNQEDCKLF